MWFTDNTNWYHNDWIKDKTEQQGSVLSPEHVSVFLTTHRQTGRVSIRSKTYSLFRKRTVWKVPRQSDWHTSIFLRVPELGYVVEEARRLTVELAVVPVGQLMFVADSCWIYTSVHTEKFNVWNMDYISSQRVFYLYSRFNESNYDCMGKGNVNKMFSE